MDRVSADEAVRTGRARRHDGYQAVIALAESCAGCTLDKFQLATAARYCPGLGRNEAALLLEYIDVISHAQIANGEAYGFIAMDLLQARTGLDDRTIRAARAGLERKGLALRNYTVANHPLPYRGFDLRPFLIQAEELLRARDAAIEAAYARRDLNGAVYKEEITSGGEEVFIRHIQSPSYPKGKSVRQEKAESASSADNPPRGRPYGNLGNKGSNGTTEVCSAGRASGNLAATPATDSQAETARATLSRARRCARSIQPFISQRDIDRLDLPAIYAGAERCVAELLPERNTGHTWQTARRNHGWRAVVMLAVALDDPSFRERSRVFGAFAHGKVEITDGFRSNLARIAQHYEEAELAAAGKRAADEAAPAAAAPVVRADWLAEAVTYLRGADTGPKVRWLSLALKRGACRKPGDDPALWAAWVADDLIKAEFPRLYEEGVTSRE